MTAGSATIIISFLVVISSLNSCDQKPGNNKQITGSTMAETASNKQEVYIDLKKVLSQNNHIKTSDIDVKYDHFFKTSKKFRGYFINTLLDSVIKSVRFDTAHAILIFECIDGYRPVMDLSKIYGDAKGYIVFEDLDSNLKKNWPDSIDKKFSPFYLAWDDVKKEDDSFMWPYGLTGLKLMSANQEYETIYPYKDAALVNGFYLFRQNCIKCHSINKIGGTMGPEFNVPRNITEYWKEQDILSFAKNPSAFRYSSHMPAITNVPDTDLLEIIRYIKSMKNNKPVN